MSGSPLPSRSRAELPVWAIRAIGGGALALALALPFLASAVGWVKHESASPHANSDSALRPALLWLPSGDAPALAMCMTEVSAQHYELVTKQPPDAHPSWADQARYLNELTRLENRARVQAGKSELSLCYDEQDWEWNRDCTGYRVPTEVEWEHAVQALAPSAFPVMIGNPATFDPDKPNSASPLGFRCARSPEPDEL